MLKEGSKFPAFTMTDQDGNEVSLKDFLGEKTLVLFYYPKASTPGCTKESIAFTENYAKFKRAGAEVFGVSADSAKAQTSFGEKYNLKVGGLLTDTKWQLAEKVGIPEHNGKPVKRQTFVIGKDGRLKLRYFYTGSGDTTSHVDESLKKVKELKKEEG